MKEDLLKIIHFHSFSSGVSPFTPIFGGVNGVKMPPLAVLAHHWSLRLSCSHWPVSQTRGASISVA